MSEHPTATRLFLGTVRVFTPRGHGSGVPIGDHVITAAHVTPNLGETVELFNGKIGRIGRYDAEVVAVSEEWDVAVLEPVDDVELAEFAVGTGGYIGEEVWHGGFPGFLGVPVIRRGIVSLVIAHPEQATLVDRNLIVAELALPTPNALLVDMPTFKGASGGPVIGSDGRVIGIVSRGPIDPTYKIPMGLAVVTRLAHAIVQTGLGERFPDLLEKIEPGGDDLDTGE